MREVINIKNNILFPVIYELLKADKKVVITVTGSSMRPFLHENVDMVELSLADFDVIKRGDIVMAIGESGRYVLHRVIEKNKNCFYMVGDAHNSIEGPFYPEQFIAVVTSIWKGKNKICCTNFLWRLLSVLWLRALPLRGIVFKTYRLIKRLA